MKREKRIARFVRLSALAGAVGLASPAAAIVGPTVDASPFADKVVMLLTRGPEGSGFCTGAVLSPTVVLTAAHCLRPSGDMLVHYRDESGAAVVVDVLATASHPGFHAEAARDRTRSLDVGLVEMKMPLPPRFHSVGLAEAPAPAPGDVVTAVGYGLSAERKPSTGGTLRAARLAVREPRSIVLLWLEGADGAGGACSGDSGGPVFAPDGASVAAVTAWTEGAGGGKCGKLTQAVLLAPLAQWVSSTIARWAAGRPGSE